MAHDEYMSRINRVMDHIDTHLDQELTLRDLSKVAHFSPFHFHRIFAAIVGETPNRFIQRLRVQKAALYLSTNPRKSVTEVAIDCGFASSATFARAFKNHYGKSATEFRESFISSVNPGNNKNSNLSKEDRKDGQKLSNLGQAYTLTDPYLDPQNNSLKWRIEMKKTEESASQLKAEVEVRKIEDATVAYARHVGPFMGKAEVFEKLWNTLMTWAGPRNLINPPKTKMLTIYHDDPDVTSEEKLRISACITIPDDTVVEGEIGKMKLEGGQYGVAMFEVAPHEYKQAWDSLYGGWLPKSGFQPDDRPAFELYLSDGKDNPEGKVKVELWVPVRPL